MAYINNIEGRELEPMSPTTTNKGGIYAQTVQDTTDMQEVFVCSNGKAYVPETDLTDYATTQYVDTKIGAIETSLETITTGSGV